jgi:hypothetical protein
MSRLQVRPAHVDETRRPIDLVFRRHRHVGRHHRSWRLRCLLRPFAGLDLARGLAGARRTRFRFLGQIDRDQLPAAFGAIPGEGAHPDHDEEQQRDGGRRKRNAGPLLRRDAPYRPEGKDAGSADIAAWLQPGAGRRNRPDHEISFMRKYLMGNTCAPKQSAKTIA